MVRPLLRTNSVNGLHTATHGIKTGRFPQARSVSLAAKVPQRIPVVRQRTKVHTRGVFQMLRITRRQGGRPLETARRQDVLRRRNLSTLLKHMAVKLNPVALLLRNGSLPLSVQLPLSERIGASKRACVKMADNAFPRMPVPQVRLSRKKEASAPLSSLWL
jgi:hypothetical protein